MADGRALRYPTHRKVRDGWYGAFARQRWKGPRAEIDLGVGLDFPYVEELGVTGCGYLNPSLACRTAQRRANVLLGVRQRREGHFQRRSPFQLIDIPQQLLNDLLGLAIPTFGNI